MPINDFFSKFCQINVSVSSSNGLENIYVDEGKPCIVNSPLDHIHITGRFKDVRRTIIHCSSKSGYSGIAIVFQNITSGITIKYLTFRNCHGNLTADVTTMPYQNQKVYYILKSNQSGALYFSNCSNILIQDLAFIYDSGIMIALINTAAVIERVNTSAGSYKLHVCNDEEVSRNISTSGIFIYYHGESYQSKSINITHLNATGNKDYSYFNKTCHYYNSNLGDLKSSYNIPVVGLAAVTIIFVQQSFAPKVYIKNSRIESNLGIMSSGMLILYLHIDEYAYSSCVVMDSVDFNRNLLNSMDESSVCTGSALQVGVFYNGKLKAQSKNGWNTTGIVLQMKNSKVTNHNITAVRIAARESPYNIKILFQNVSFENNQYDNYGIAIVAEGIYGLSTSVARLQIVMDQVTAINNSVQLEPFKTDSIINVPMTISGVFVFTNIDTVVINGTSAKSDCNNSAYYSYSQNHASVFVGIGTDFQLNNSLCFYNNIATSGAAFHLSSFSHLFISCNASINFVRNNASTVGGAIATTSNSNAGTMCLIQLPKEENYTMIFKDNYAKLGGLAIYGGPLYQCQQIAKAATFHMTDVYFGPQFKIDNSGSHQCRHRQVQSVPWKVVFCNKSQQYINVYPGSVIRLNITVVDVIKCQTPSKVYIYFNTKLNVSTNVSSASFDLRPGKCYNTCNNYSDTCNTVPLTIYSTGYGSVNLGLATESNNPTLVQKLMIKKCPTGFDLSSNKCECSKFIKSMMQKYAHTNISCEIQDVSISRNNYFWMGMIDNKTLGFSAICPLGYCTSTKSFSINDDLPKHMCVQHRTGKICGSCETNYSVVFGRNTCHKCSSLSLLNILGIAVLGIVLVIIMYSLQLTLDKGTVGGVIFYANTLIIGIFYSHDIKHSDYGYHVTYVYLINLSINFKLCFFNGMTEVVKVGFKFIFPIYIWLLVCIIVIVSRYSTRISNLTSKRSVQVLTTLVHLSLARFLLTVMEIFAFVQLHLENGKTEVVWLASGDVPYGKTIGHICLLVVATITVLILIPYLLMTSLAPYCYGCYIVNRFKPVFDSIYAPYKTSKRYWYGVRQMLLVFFYVSFAVSTGENKVEELATIKVWILAIFAILQLFLRPFRSPWIHCIDSFYMVLLVAMGFVAFNIFNNSNTWPWITLNVLLQLGFAVLICIIVYHILLALNLITPLTMKWAILKWRITRMFSENQELSMTVQRSDEYMNIMGSNDHHSNSNRLRESLLSDRHFPFRR